jgi:hypothetical protein
LEVNDEEELETESGGVSFVGLEVLWMGVLTASFLSSLSKGTLSARVRVLRSRVGRMELRGNFILVVLRVLNRLWNWLLL